MKKSANFFSLSAVVLVVFSIPVIWAQNILAEPGNYPGKWYGWWHPTEKIVAPVDGAMPEFENQKIIKSWGYQTGNSLEEIRDLFPGDGFYEICLKNPKVWGDFRINETPYIPYGKKEWIEATEKYKGTASLDEKGHLRNYKAGIPFPGTKDPIEMIWNMVKNRLQGDNYGNIVGVTIQAVIDKNGHTRWLLALNLQLFFDGRLVMDPKPLYEPNPRNFMYLHSFGFLSPSDLKGTFTLDYRYDDPDKQDDMWMYITALRRIRRMSTAQRWDRVNGGNDTMWDTFQAFSGKPTNYKWKYHGKKELLGMFHASQQPQMQKNRHLGACDQFWQRINCEVLEGIPQITSPVSRFLLFLEPQTYVVLWSICYDKRGREWLVYYSGNPVDKKWNKAPTNMTYLDLQRTHASTTCLLGAGGDCEWLGRPAFFTLNKLKLHFGGR